MAAKPSTLKTRRRWEPPDGGIPEAKLRLDSFLVQPVLKWGDGEELSPGPPIQPQAVTLAGLRDLLENWPAKLAEIEAQLDARKLAS